MLSFFSEPEAAALASMPKAKFQGGLAVGDSFIVLDAGGATVRVSTELNSLVFNILTTTLSPRDVISYKVNKLAPLSTSKFVEGEGEFSFSMAL